MAYNQMKFVAPDRIEVVVRSTRLTARKFIERGHSSFHGWGTAPKQHVVDWLRESTPTAAYEADYAWTRFIFESEGDAIMFKLAFVDDL